MKRIILFVALIPFLIACDDDDLGLSDEEQVFQHEWREGYWTFDTFAVEGVHEGYHFTRTGQGLMDDGLNFEHFAVYHDSLPIHVGNVDNWGTDYFEEYYEMRLWGQESLPFVEQWRVNPIKSDSLNIYVTMSGKVEIDEVAFNPHGGDYHLVRITSEHYDSLKALGEVDDEEKIYPAEWRYGYWTRLDPDTTFGQYKEAYRFIRSDNNISPEVDEPLFEYFRSYPDTVVTFNGQVNHWDGAWYYEPLMRLWSDQVDSLGVPLFAEMWILDENLSDSSLIWVDIFGQVFDWAPESQPIANRKGWFNRITKEQYDSLKYN